MGAYECQQNTPPGSNIIVEPQDPATGTTPVTMTFTTVQQVGDTTLTVSSDGPEVPEGFSLGDPATYYDIATTASYEGLIAVCINYGGVSVPEPEESLRLLHYEDGQWVDCTVSLDTQSDIICGAVTSLSPFAVGADVAPPVFESLMATPNVLWPPSHKMVPITVAWTATDNLDPSPAVTLKNIVMNEGDQTNTYDPMFDETVGDGYTIGDIQVDANGNIFLRAERSGTATSLGRTYTLTYEATDEAGNTATAAVVVAVPHDAS